MAPFRRPTPREHEVASLVKRDFSNYEIARELGLKVGTVKYHVHNLLPLFASGLGALGLLGWRRKRKSTTSILAA